MAALSRVALPVLIGHAENVLGGVVSYANGVYTLLFLLESLLKINHGYTAVDGLVFDNLNLF